MGTESLPGRTDGIVDGGCGVSMHMYDEKGLFCDWPTAADGAYPVLLLFWAEGR